jgi:alpha-L-rhamnosidase
MKKLFIMVVLSVCYLDAVAQIGIYDQRCENLHSPLGIDNTCPHFSWKLSSAASGDKQTAYEIQIASSAENLETGTPDLWDSGKVGSEQSVMVDYRGEKLSSRDLCYWRVRVWDKDNEVSDWSPVDSFSVGILDNAMTGQYIGIREEDGDVQSPLVWKELVIDHDGKVFAHINSLGYHELYVNGEKVSEHVLQPAVSQLDKRSLIVTYDITRFVKRGTNSLVVWLGQGWYRNNVFKTKYKGPLVKAEIDQQTSDGWQVIAQTDETWQVSASGYHDTGRWDGLGFGGERVDGAMNPHTMSEEELNDRDWHRPHIETMIDVVATPQMFGGNRIGEIINPSSVVLQENGSWLVDMGKVFTGWLNVSFPNMKLGDGFKIEYTDHIMPGKTFESQGESDVYSSSGNPEYDVFSNKFHHHVMRYALITPFEEALGDEVLARETPGKIPVRQAPNVVGMAITGTEDGASKFLCSDDDINQIHDMIHRTVQNLTFSGYMVDCPHLERQGYGGDGNASTMTLQTMFDVADTYYNWMQAWGDVMDENGSLPYVAPAGGGGGGPFWCEFFIKAPWRTWLNYGDSRLLECYYDQAKRWLGYVDACSVNHLLTPWPDTDQRVWWLGDWLAPNGVDVDSEATKGVVNNCVVSDAYQTMIKIAEVLGKDDDVAVYEEKVSSINNAISWKYYDYASHTIGAATPLDMSYSLLTGVVPVAERVAAKDKLLMLQKEKYGNHIAVGLVGVPVFTEWITREREVDVMMTLLKQRDYPGYLYMIDHGATATWEYWDGTRSHLHNCYNGIGTWFYQAVAGLVPDETHPGYKHFFIDPQFPEGITYTKVSKPTPYGDIRVEWHKDSDGSIGYVIDVPVGTSATIVNRLEGDMNEQLLGSGHHELVYPTRTNICDQTLLEDSDVGVHNLAGQKVNSSYKGIIVNKGRKEIRK